MGAIGGCPESGTGDEEPGPPLDPPDDDWPFDAVVAPSGTADDVKQPIASGNTKTRGWNAQPRESERNECKKPILSNWPRHARPSRN